MKPSVRAVCKAYQSVCENVTVTVRNYNTYARGRECKIRSRPQAWFSIERLLNVFAPANTISNIPLSRPRELAANCHSTTGHADKPRTITCNIARIRESVWLTFLYTMASDARERN